MLRTTRKYLPCKFKDLLQFYYLKYEGKLFSNINIESRSEYITKLNYFYRRFVHQGKTYVFFKATKFHLGYKVGQFTKTRKPFFFRSKKKKNCLGLLFLFWLPVYMIYCFI